MNTGNTVSINEIVDNIFKAYDRNQDAELSRYEIRLYFEKQRKNLDERFINAIFKKMDIDQNQGVSASELKKFLTETQANLN